MIQFNKNTFDLAAGGPLQNVSEGPPNSVLQVTVKNNQQHVWYFTDKIPLQALFVEDGKMERGAFLETWKSLPDSHEVAKDLPNALITNVDATLEKLATTNLFYIARRVLKDTNQEVLYLSGKVPPSIPQEEEEEERLFLEKGPLHAEVQAIDVLCEDAGGCHCNLI